MERAGFFSGAEISQLFPRESMVKINNEFGKP